MNNKSDEHLRIMQATIESNKQDYDEKMKKLTEYLTAMITPMMDHIEIYKSSPDQKYSPKDQDPTTIVPDNNRYPPFEGGHSTKIVSMWTLKHDISSPKFNELPTKTELKGDISMDLKKFYNQINMPLNVVTRIRGDLLTYYHSIKRHSEF